MFNNFKDFKKDEKKSVDSTPDWNGNDDQGVESSFAPTTPPPFGDNVYSAPSTSAGMALATRNVLNSDVSVVGTLRFEDELLVDGSVEGEIISDGVLTVGINASILSSGKTAIRTQSAIIHGKVAGNIEVTDRVELAATAEVVGNITAAKISIQEGAVFIGLSTIGVASQTLMPMSAGSKKSGSEKAKKDEVSPEITDLLS